MSNFISVTEAVEFFYCRGFETIHYMGEGRIMSNQRRPEVLLHIRPKDHDGVVAYEITNDQLEDMIEAMEYNYRRVYSEEIAA